MTWDLRPGRRLFEGLPRYRNVHEFGFAKPARRRSAEHDYGIGWRLGFGSTWRISWIRATGEVYCAELAPGTEVVVIGVFAEAAHVAEALGDWPAICGDPGTLEIAFARVQDSPWRLG